MPGEDYRSGRTADVAEKAFTTGNRILHGLLRGVGHDQCLRPVLSPAVSSFGNTNGLSSSSASSAGRARAHSYRNAGGPLWRPCCFHRSDVFCRPAGSSSTGRYPLPKFACRGIPSGNGGVFICRWSRLRIPLVLHGEPGQCARRVWPRQYWPVCRGLPRAGGSRRVRFSHSLLGNVGYPLGLGRAVRYLRPKRSPTPLAPRDSRKCSACSHANLWRGHSRRSIF